MPFSEAQCQQIMQLIQVGMKNISPWSSSHTGSHLAGNISTITPVHFASSIKLISSVAMAQWILDSGATDHITPFVQLLDHPTAANSVIHLPTGQTYVISYIGHITLPSNIKLLNVLCVPTFKYNLLSISKLTTDNSCFVSFSSTRCLLQDHSLKRSIEIGSLDGGLYKLNVNGLQSSSLCAISNSCNHFSTKLHSCNKSSTTLWHARLGHVPIHVMKQLPFDIDVTVDSHCDVCHLSKQTRLPFPLSSSTSVSKFELIH